MGTPTPKTLLIILANYFLISNVHSQYHYPNQYLSPVQKILKSHTVQKHSPLVVSPRQEEEPTSTTTLAPFPHPPAPFPSSAANKTPPRCGETFNCTSSGIFHRPFEPVLPNERCVWTVVVPGASGYQVDVFYLGWDPLDNKTGSRVLINGFKKGSPPTEISPSGKGIVTISEASLLVVTYISGENPGNSTGFILQYTTLYNGSVSSVAPQSVHQLIQPETIYMRHPTASNNYYQNNELSSFVFQPENNIHVPGKRINIVYMRISLDGAVCNDFLDVYGLNVTEDGNGSMAKWDFRGRICGYLDTQLITGDDMIMMIFQTDQSGTNYGFHLTYTTC